MMIDFKMKIYMCFAITAVVFLPVLVSVIYIKFCEITNVRYVENRLMGHIGGKNFKRFSDTFFNISINRPVSTDFL